MDEKSILISKKQQEICNITSELESSVSEIGDWKIAKYQEYVLAGQPAPYDINELYVRPSATRSTPFAPRSPSLKPPRRSHVCRAKSGAGRHDRTGVRFERIRRITGYLVGGLDRFNDGKAAEGARQGETHEI